jgi:hypothetical protein
MFQTSVKAPIGSQQRGRVGQIIQRQAELRAELVADPLLPLTIVREALGGISYGKLNRLLSTGQIAFWQPVKRGQRRVRQSSLMKYLRQGDQHGVAP